jgi:quercetin dioxygenase-like cupin family protein
MQRRKFLQASLAASPFALSMPFSIPGFPERNNKGFKVNAGEGRYHGHIHLQASQNVIDVKVSGKDTAGDLAVFQSNTASKGGPPLHVHFNQDEIFYVLEGEYLFQVGEEKHQLKPGDTIFLPRNMPHTWASLQNTGKLVVVLQPAGKMEEFFLAAGSPAAKDFTPEQRAKNFEKHEMKVIGPPLKFD